VRAAAGRVTTAAHPGDAARDADLLVESLPEDLELKASVLREALAGARHPVVATNTSSLSITAIGEAIGAPERTLGTHYLNPPLLMPTVEVIAGERTAPETVSLVQETLVALGKLPVLVGRDVPGFVWNRLQFALVRECAWLVEHGVASPEDVDTVMREGLARRWRRVGPLRAIALGGVDTWNRSARAIVPDLSTARELPDLAEVAITDGDLSTDAATRDGALARELREERAIGASRGPTTRQGSSPTFAAASSRRRPRAAGFATRTRCAGGTRLGTNGASPSPSGSSSKSRPRRG
jgi:3-hydroxybutyryl-CoA dehydrogenase